MWPSVTTFSPFTIQTSWTGSAVSAGPHYSCEDTILQAPTTLVTSFPQGLQDQYIVLQSLTRHSPLVCDEPPHHSGGYKISILWESLKRPSGRLSLQRVGFKTQLPPRYCGPCATKCNVWPGANLGFNLTRVACYCTLPDMGT